MNMACKCLILVCLVSLVCCRVVAMQEAELAKAASEAGDAKLKKALDEVEQLLPAAKLASSAVAEKQEELVCVKEALVFSKEENMQLVVERDDAVAAAVEREEEIAQQQQEVRALRGRVETLQTKLSESEQALVGLKKMVRRSQQQVA